MPTSEQIEKVKENLRRLSNLKDSIHDFSQDKLNEAINLFSAPSEEDTSQKMMSNLLGYAISGVSTATGQPEIKTAYTVLSGIYKMFETDTPQSLNTQFANVWDRFNKNFTVASDFYAFYADNTENYWQVEFTNPTTNQKVTVGELADINIPNKVSVEFNKIRTSAVEGIELRLWKYLASIACEITYYPSHNPVSRPVKGESDVKQLIHEKIKSEQSVFHWYDLGDKDSKGYYNADIYEEELLLNGKTPTEEFCKKLIKDDGVGNILNPNAIADREVVFKEWKIPYRNIFTTTKYIINNDRIKILSSFDREKLNVFRKCTFGTDRIEFNRQIIDKSKQDLAFRIALHKNPRSAIETYLNLAIPESINLRVFFEDSKHYKFVLPNSLDRISIAKQIKDIKLPSGEIHRALQELDRTEIEYFILRDAFQDTELMYGLLTNLKDTLRSKYNIRVPKELEFEVIEEGSYEYIIVIPY